MAGSSAVGASRAGADAGRRGRPTSAPRRRGPEEVQRITTAPVGQRQHQQQQIGRYLVSMGIRLVCVVLIMVVESPVRWAFVPLAVVLPYIAVLVANAGRESVRPTTTQVVPVAQPALAPAAPQEPLVGDVHEPDAGPERRWTASAGGDGADRAAQGPRAPDVHEQRADGDQHATTPGAGGAWRGAA